MQLDMLHCPGFSERAWTEEHSGAPGFGVQDSEVTQVESLAAGPGIARRSDSRSTLSGRYHALVGSHTLTVPREAHA